jgi:hypothetical protein
MKVLDLFLKQFSEFYKFNDDFEGLDVVHKVEIDQLSDDERLQYTEMLDSIEEMHEHLTSLLKGAK